MLKIKNKIIAVILGLILCSFTFFPVYAVTPDVNGDKSTISLEYKYNEEIFVDVKVSIYYVSKWEDHKFTLTDDFKNANTTIDFSTTPNASQWKTAGEVIAKYAKDNKLTALKCVHTDKNGIAKFENLENGIYYVQIEDVLYNKSKLICDPILVTVPAYEGTTNSWEYEVNIEPKLACIEIPDKPDKPNEPDKPDTPDDPDESIPNTGTLSYLVMPLSLIGILIFSIGLFSFLKERNINEKES